MNLCANDKTDDRWSDKTTNTGQTLDHTNHGAGVIWSHINDSPVNNNITPSDDAIKYLKKIRCDTKKPE